VSVRNLHPIGDLLRIRALDADLGALLGLLLAGRTPLVAVGPPGVADRVTGGLACLLPDGARTLAAVPDDDFAWLPEASRLGWTRDRARAVEGPGPVSHASPADAVLLVRGLASPGGVTGERARLVVRALAIGYGLLATMRGDGLDDALAALHDPSVGTTADERSRLGVVLAVADDEGTPRITAAHYVRPVALDTHGHVQRPAPAVLATWNPQAARFEHFWWGVVPDLAGRLGITPRELERDQARRASALMDLLTDVRP
jgi:hypothetical protein